MRSGSPCTVTTSTPGAGADLDPTGSGGCEVVLSLPAVMGGAPSPVRRGGRSALLPGLMLSICLSASVLAAEGPFPSPWGPDDEIGAANLLTPAKVVEAARLVTTGRTYALGIPVGRNTPAFPPRFVSITTFSPGQSGAKVFGSNGGTYNDDLLVAWLGTGTQIDGLGHLGAHHVYYNNNHAEDFVKPAGLTKLGIEKVPPIVTRGVLLDIAKVRGKTRLEAGEAIGVADLEAAMRSEGVQVTKGDVVILHTGWLSLLEEDPQTFISKEPGIGVEAARWLVAQGVVAIGADNWGIDVVPHEDPASFFPAHVETLAKGGVYLLENIDTRGLVADGVFEFLFVLGQARVEGAVQMIINPVAIR